MTSVTRRQDGTIDLLDPDNFTERMPYEELGELREGARAHWFARDDGDGFWVLSRYEDVVHVSRHPELFSSWQNGAIVRRRVQMLEDAEAALAGQRLMMLNMDPPDHTKLRGIVQKAFTPRRVLGLEPRLRELTNEIIDSALEKGEGDFVPDVAAELPLEAIAELMGIPLEDRRKIFDWSNQMIGSEDPDFQTDAQGEQAAAGQIYLYANEMAEARRKEPREDIITTLIHAEVDGEKLENLEFEMFFVLLAVAGNETTRNAISHGMLGFLEHPDQWERLRADRSLLDSAIEEVLRWATPVMQFQRTATQDLRIGEQDIAAGDKVAIYYSTANRDPEVFDDPDRFDIGRDPNPHIAFGGGGPHFCLGANLARLELRLMFEALVERMPELEPTGPVRRLRSSFINGIKAMPVRYQ